MSRAVDIELLDRDRVGPLPSSSSNMSYDSHMSGGEGGGHHRGHGRRPKSGRRGQRRGNGHVAHGSLGRSTTATSHQSLSHTRDTDSVVRYSPEDLARMQQNRRKSQLLAALESEQLYDAEHDDNYTVSELEIAKAHQEDRVIKRYDSASHKEWELYPFWSTDPTTISALGEGVVLLFRFLQRGMGFYAVMTVAALFNVVANFAGNKLEGRAEGADDTFFFRISLGNWYAHGHGPDYRYGGVAAGVMTLFMLYMWRATVDWQRLARKTLRATAASYSVMFTDIPNPLRVRMFAEHLADTYGPVVSVCMVNESGDKYSGLCQECVEYINYKYDKEGVEEKVRDPLTQRRKEKKKRAQRKMGTLGSRMRSVDAIEEPVDLRKVDIDGTMRTVNAIHLHEYTEAHQLVIVTFRYAADADECIHNHREHKLYRFCGCLLGRCSCCDCHPPLFNGHRFRAERPREPSDILWNNFSVRTRLLRGFIAVLTVIAVCIVYGLVLQAAQASRESISTELAAVVGIGLSVLGVIVERLFLKVTHWERHQSKSATQLSMMRKALVANLLANVVVMYLVFRLPNDSRDAKWYRTGGQVITSLVLADVVVPNFVRAFHPVARIKRFFIRVFCLDQEALNAAYENELQVYKNYVAIMASMSWAFIYAGVLPVIIPATLVKLMLLYVLEKYNVLRRYGKPDAVDDRVASFFVKMLPFFAAAHGAFTVFALRTRRIDLLNDDYYPNDPREEDNLYDAGTVMLPPVVVCFTVLLFGNFMATFVRTLCGIRVCSSKRASRFHATLSWRTVKTPEYEKELKEREAAALASGRYGIDSYKATSSSGSGNGNGKKSKVVSVDIDLPHEMVRDLDTYVQAHRLKGYVPKTLSHAGELNRIRTRRPSVSNATL